MSLKIPSLKLTKVTVEAANGGWIVRQCGKPPEIFTSWLGLLAHLSATLTTSI